MLLCWTLCSNICVVPAELHSHEPWRRTHRYKLQYHRRCARSGLLRHCSHSAAPLQMSVRDTDHDLEMAHGRCINLGHRQFCASSAMRLCQCAQDSKSALPRQPESRPIARTASEFNTDSTGFLQDYERTISQEDPVCRISNPAEWQ